MKIPVHFMKFCLWQLKRITGPRFFKETVSNSQIAASYISRFESVSLLYVGDSARQSLYEQYRLFAGMERLYLRRNC